ncbi:hypothetical protein TL16_g07148 [Triparma laevis f. inornata]|uniref:Uncharacterized protein n=1 Tax=Triparma laevis f. inornata TaxID=1714386 RepID=A0A9W7AZ89_9STRA|nr:hypothetical protein TL16_g07148 [Triparma laevis f. inornata]
MMIKSKKILPIESETSTALSVMRLPDATLYTPKYNGDLETEGETVRQMDNVVQGYTFEEDEIITSALGGLISGLKMKGAIPFKDFSTTFSTAKWFKGFYNAKDGDIYSTSNYTCRGAHSQVAARLADYHHTCKNLAFGLMEAQGAGGGAYLEIPNDHSMVYKEDYDFPSPLTHRETIVKIVWKRLSEKSIMVAYHPLTTHPLVANKDGKTTIRATLHGAMLVTQIDNGTTEANSDFHINFGGNLPRPVINGFIIPNFNRIASHHQSFFAYSLGLEALSEADGKLLGEVFVNQIKQARKRGGWKKRAELGQVGVDEFLYISVAMRKFLHLCLWFRALLHEISLNRVKGAPTVTTALSDLKDHDAINLAKGLSTIVLTSAEAESAIDHWSAQNVALEEFEAEHPWMRPFFVEVAQYNLKTSDFGLKFRVFAGAMLSTIDLVTDVYMTLQFLNTDGRESFGSAPNDYIPYDWRMKYNKTKGRVTDPQLRRRSSIQQVKTLLGGVEER